MDERLKKWAHARGLSESDLRTLGGIVEDMVADDTRSSGVRRRELEPPQTIELPERYRDLGRLTRGGSAEIRRAHDATMDREVAMKIVAWEHMDSARRLARFRNEARITARLEHPGVVPVYDAGVLPDGRPYFTMKLVRGEPLEQLIRDPETASDPKARRRRVWYVLRICETLAYAHSAGVVHRDLKPANVMVGAFGELLVMDWGIARDSSSPREEGGGLSDPDALEDGLATRAGDVFGTVGYMAPEQARGTLEEIGPASDVWAVGLLLYEALVGHRAFEGRAASVWARVVAGESPRLPADVDVSDALVDVLKRATRPIPSQRYSDAAKMVEELSAWLDGEAARDRARALVDQSRRLVPVLRRLKTRREELEGQAKDVRREIRDTDSDQVKRPLWELEDEVESLSQQALLIEEERLELLRASLQHDAEDVDAQAELASLYRSRVEESELARRTSEAARWELLLRRYDRGAHSAFLNRLGRLTLVTHQPAPVRALRLESKDRRLLPAERLDLGTAPLHMVELEAGSYLIELEVPGRELVRYPVFIARDGHWHGVPPGETEPRPIELPAAGSLAADVVFVPAGWATVGGDPLAAEAFERGSVWVDDFAIGRHPVTVGEYLAFLDAISEERGMDAAWRLAPRAPKGAQGENADVVAVRRGDGGFELLEEQGVPTVTRRCPVAGVSCWAAEEYARWRAQRDGVPWRLPTELEWEKAARGVDERAFPWGMTLEPTWTRILRSPPNPPGRLPVELFETDVSPYGVRGLGGNVRDWTASVWTPERRPGHTPSGGDSKDELRVIRGGAWHTVPAFARSACRFAAKASEHFPNVGLRLARSL